MKDVIDANNDTNLLHHCSHHNKHAVLQVLLEYEKTHIDHKDVVSLSNLFNFDSLEGPH